MEAPAPSEHAPDPLAIGAEPAAVTIGPAPPPSMPAGRGPWACLAALQGLGAQETVAACLEAVAAGARRLDALREDEAAQRARAAAHAFEVHRTRWEIAAHALHLEERGLLPAAGYRSADHFLGASWPGDAASRTYLHRYLNQARHLREDIALTPGHSPRFLHALAEVRDAGAIDWLWAQVRTGRPLRLVRRGVAAATEARRRGGSPEEIRRAAEEGIEQAQRERRLPARATRRQSACAELHRALREALPYLDAGAEEAARRLLLHVEQGTAPAASAPERRQRPRTEEAEAVKPVSAEPAAPGSLPASVVAENPAEAIGPGPEVAAGPDAADAPEAAAPGVAAAPPADVPASVTPRVPAPRPPRRSPCQELIPVGSPAYDADYSAAERHACAALVALHHGQLHADRLLHLHRRERQPIRNALQLCYAQVASAYAAVRRAAEPALAPFAESGRPAQEAVLAGYPGVPPEDLWPLEVRPERAGPPLLWLAVDVIDPLGCDEPSEAEVELFWVCGLVEAATAHLTELLARLGAHDEVSDTLLYQLERQMYAARGFIGGLQVQFYYGILLAQEELRERQPELEAARQRALQADAMLTVLGDDEVPPALVKVGQGEDGAHVAVTLDQAFVIVALGATGVGKSQLGVQLCEGLLLDLPGLNRLPRPGVPVIFAADWRKGRTRHQHLRGFSPNSDPWQWQALRERYAVTFGQTNAAYCRGVLCCLPGTAEAYRAQYPDLLERGLEVRELRLHPSEWSNFAYGLMLGGGERGAGRSQYQGFLSNLRALLGEGASPARIREEFGRSGLGGPSKRAVEAGLSLMERLTSGEERAADLIRADGVPVFVYLEGGDLAAEQVLGVQLCLMSALGRPLPANDPYVLFVLEEVAKHGVSEALWRAYEEMTREVRHGRRSLYLVAHLPTDVPAGVLQMASGVFQFSGTSPDAHRKLRELTGLYRDVTAQEVMELPDRVALAGFRRASSARFRQAAQRVWLRPSCVDAGGESVRGE